MGVGLGDWAGVEGVWGGGREPQLGSWGLGGLGGEFELCVGSARLSAAPTQSPSCGPSALPGILLPRGHVINEVEVS